MVKYAGLERTSVWMFERQGLKRVFRHANSAGEETKLFEDTIAKSMRDSTKYRHMEKFNEWQLVRANKDIRSESYTLMFDLGQVQRLDVDMTRMIADSLRFSLSKFIEKFANKAGNVIRKELFTVVCGLKWHFLKW